MSQHCPFVIVSILNWNNFEDTIKCVHSLRDLDYTNFQIIILDNASTNQSYNELKHTFPELTIRRTETNDGYAAGHYHNYLEAKKNGADLFWILNSDLEVDQKALSALVKAYQKNPKGIYGSVSLIPGEEDRVDFGGAELTALSSRQLTYNSWKGRSYSELRAAHGEVYEVESVEGSSMLLPMAVIETYGFMHTDFFMYGEEVEYCYRCRKNKISSYLCTSSKITHKNEGSLKSSENLRLIPIYYRKRNVIRLKKELFGMSIFNLYREGDNIFSLFKSLLKGYFKKCKLESYYFALAQIHGLLGIKGKKIKPEQLL